MKWWESTPDAKCSVCGKSAHKSPREARECATQKPATPVTPPVSDWKPYAPPWWPFETDPGQIVSNMSNNIITRYDAWTATLPDGELLRRIDSYRQTCPDYPAAGDRYRQQLIADLARDHDPR